MWLKIHNGMIYTADGTFIGRVREAQMNFREIDMRSFDSFRSRECFIAEPVILDVGLDIFADNLNFHAPHDEAEDAVRLTGKRSIAHQPQDETIDGEFTEVPPEQLGHES